MRKSGEPNRGNPRFIRENLREKKSLQILLVLVFSALFSVSSVSQPLSTTSKKAEKYFYSASDYYGGRAFDRALRELDRAITEDPVFLEAYILKGDILADQNKIADAVASYKKAISINPEFSPNLYYIAGNLELTVGMYSDAQADLLGFLDFPDLPPEKRRRAEGLLRNCDFGINAVGHPVPFNPVNLGENINTTDDEYVNAITADDQKLYFTRMFPANAQTLDLTARYEEDFYVAEIRDTSWGMAMRLPPPVNTHGNEGAMCISPDGQFIFFAACNREDGYGSCDLYWSRKVGNEWTVPQNMGPVVNSPSWDSQPAFSSDGRTLYFASKREGGKGSSDIWKTELQDNAQWSVPVNLGDSINTRLEEMAPFIHPDDQTLYFSSRGHMGMGGLDLFLARKEPDGSWSRPVNLGYPINTFSDEITLVVDPGGELAYISSDKLGGKGRQDIYSFRLYKEAQPVRATYFKGIVYDTETKKRLEARFELISLASGKTVVVSNSDAVNGEFLLSLPVNQNYALNVSKDGYLFYSDNFLLTGEGSRAKPIVKNIPLQPVRIGETVILKNIYFDTDKYDLRPESLAELEKLQAFLEKNPGIRIELSGHTDNIGTEEHNRILSLNRAKAVYEYLLAHGISGSRLSYAGYGFSKPIDTNETDEGRANNRRTEFKVVGN